MKDPIVGIDLGTSNSVVAHGDEAGVVKVLADDGGYKIHPSVVSFHPNGGVVVGAGAKQRKVIDPQNTIYSVKRLIGRGYRSPEVQTAKTRVPYQIKEGANQLPMIATRGGEFAVPEISAIVLDHMRNIATARLGCGVSRAVVTVPASFNDAQRSATATAGAIAGLTIVRVLNEPTAAALAYGHSRNLREIIAVYDFGGGTFDITILKLNDQVYEVLGTAGDTFLGGDDLDERLVDKMVAKFLAENRLDLRTNEVAMMRLRAVAEQTKIELSRRSRAVVRIDEIAYGPRGAALNLQIEVTRDEFVGQVADIIDRTFPVCQEALAIAGIGIDQIADVVLVGGTTKIPYVRDQVSKFFAKSPRTDVNPEDAVAVGAALQAQSLEKILSRPRKPSREMPAVAPMRAPSDTHSSIDAGDSVDSFTDVVAYKQDDDTSGSVTMAPVDDLTTGRPKRTTSGYSEVARRPTQEVEKPDTSYSITRGNTRDFVEPGKARTTTATKSETRQQVSTEETTRPAGGYPTGDEPTKPSPPIPFEEPTRPAPPDAIALAEQLLREARGNPDKTREAPNPLLALTAFDAEAPKKDTTKPGVADPHDARIPPPPPAQPIGRMTRTGQAPVVPPGKRTAFGVAPGPAEPPPVPSKTQRVPAQARPPAIPAPKQQAPINFDDPIDKITQTTQPMIPVAPPRKPPPPPIDNDWIQPDKVTTAATTQPMSPVAPKKPSVRPPSPTDDWAEPDSSITLEAVNEIVMPTPATTKPMSPVAPIAPPTAPTLVALAPDFAAEVDSVTATNNAAAAAAAASSTARGMGPMKTAQALAVTDAPSAPVPAPYGADPLSSPYAAVPVPPSRSAPIVLEVTPRGLGVGTVAGFCEELIRRNSRVPAETKKTFTTSRDKQQIVRIVICQGESRRLDNNTIIGDLVLQNLPAKPRGETAIEVTFVLDASGILQVRARDAHTGAEQRASLDPIGGVPQQDVPASRERIQQLGRRV